MFRHGDCSTETDKRTFLFTLIAFAACLTAAVLLFVLGRGSALAVFAGILVGVVAAASGAVLFAMVTDYAFIKDDTLCMRYLFRTSQVPLDKIAGIRFKDEVYSVYGPNGELLGTINARLTGIDRVLHKLDASGIRSV